MFRYRVTLVAVAVMGLTACKSVTLGNQHIEWANELTERRKVNQNWNADCVTDDVTGARRCFAGAFGQAMGAGGYGYGGKDIPFQVYYLDKEGPFISVGWNTYPGQNPIIRLDGGGPAYIVKEDGGVSAPEPQPDLVDKLTNAHTVRARYYVWPEGPRDVVVEILGFMQAWDRLQELVAGRARSPSELMPPPRMN